jgi:hypothetical protein
VFETVETSFNGVAVLVDPPGECWWAAAFASFGFTAAIWSLRSGMVCAIFI